MWLPSNEAGALFGFDFSKVSDQYGIEAVEPDERE